MTFSEIKAVFNLADNICADQRELLEAVQTAILGGSAETADYDYLVVRDDYILQAVSDSISSDTYVLGCFNASFIANSTDWPQVLVEAAQKGGAYTEIGEAIVEGGFVDALAEAYISADGAGHCLSSYDGEEHELRFASESHDGEFVNLSVFRR